MLEFFSLWKIYRKSWMSALQADFMIIFSKSFKIGRQMHKITKPLYGCKALLHTLVKYGFVEFILQVPTFFSLSSFSFVFLQHTKKDREKCAIEKFIFRSSKFLEDPEE